PMAGCAWDEAADWRVWIADQNPDCEVWSPMRGKDFLREIDRIPEGGAKLQSPDLARQGIDAAVSSQHSIVWRDHWDVSNADILIVNLLPAVATGVASIGTCFELAWAWKMQKPALVAMQDINPNTHPFVLEAAYIVLPTLQEVNAAARTLLNLPLVPDAIQKQNRCKDGCYDQCLT
ncbi:hypothetical protein LCGC14_2747480, partial [marine sediment metagenome]